MSHDYHMTISLFMEGDLPFRLSTPSQGASDFLKCGETTPSEPPGERKARRPLRMTIFS